MNDFNAMIVSKKINQFKMNSNGFKQRLSELISMIAHNPVTAESQKKQEELEKIEKQYQLIENKIDELYNQYLKGFQESKSLFRNLTHLDDSFKKSHMNADRGSLNDMLSSLNNDIAQSMSSFKDFNQKINDIVKISNLLDEELKKANLIHVNFDKWNTDNHYGMELFSDLGQALIEQKNHLQKLFVSSRKYELLNQKFSRFEKQSNGAMDNKLAFTKLAAFHHFLTCHLEQEQIEIEYDKLLATLKTASKYEQLKYNEHLNELVAKNRLINKERKKEAIILSVLALILLGVFIIGATCLFFAAIPSLVLFAAFMPALIVAKIVCVVGLLAIGFALPLAISLFTKLLIHSLDTSSAAKALLSEDITELDTPEKRTHFYGHAFYQELCDEAKAIRQKDNEMSCQVNDQDLVRDMIFDSSEDDDAQVNASNYGFFSYQAGSSSASLSDDEDDLYFSSSF